MSSNDLERLKREAGAVKAAEAQAMRELEKKLRAALAPSVYAAAQL
jgi:hypothetical protein